MVIRGLKEVVRPLIDTFSLKLLIKVLRPMVNIYSSMETKVIPKALAVGAKFIFAFGF